MPTQHRPLRSLVPYLTREKGSRYTVAGAEEIVGYGPDAIWMDLDEDFTHHARVEAAREEIAEVVRTLGGRGVAVLVRIHEASDPEAQRKDLEALVCPELYGILTPKTHPGTITEVAAMLDEVERAKGVEPGHTVIFPLLEDALAVEKSYDIAIESDRIAHMGWCISKDGDPSRDIGFRWSPSGEETRYMRSRTLMAARAAGVPHPMSGGWINEDLEGLRRFAKGERDLGYMGMHCYGIPEFIAAVNEVFTPTQQEIESWQEIVALEEEADREGWRRRYTTAQFAKAQLEYAAKLGLVKEGAPA